MCVSVCILKSWHSNKISFILNIECFQKLTCICTFRSCFALPSVDDGTGVINCCCWKPKTRDEDQDLSQMTGEFTVKLKFKTGPGYWFLWESCELGFPKFIDIFKKKQINAGDFKCALHPLTLQFHAASAHFTDVCWLLWPKTNHTMRNH